MEALSPNPGRSFWRPRAKALVATDVRSPKLHLPKFNETRRRAPSMLKQVKVLISTVLKRINWKTSAWAPHCPGPPKAPPRACPMRPSCIQVFVLFPWTFLFLHSQYQILNSTSFSSHTFLYLWPIFLAIRKIFSLLMHQYQLVCRLLFLAILWVLRFPFLFLPLHFFHYLIFQTRPIVYLNYI